MTASNVSGWLPPLVGPVVIQTAGVAVTQRPTWNFIGCTVVDNPGSLRTDFTLVAAGLLDANIAAGAAIVWSKLAAGAVTLPAVTSFITSVNAKCTASSREPVNVQTTTATVTTLDSFTLASGTAITVSWTVTAFKSDFTQMASYVVTAAFKNNAGTVAQVGTTLVTVLGESDAAWDATADSTGTTIRLRITGKVATTIQWGATGSVVAVVP